MTTKNGVYIFANVPGQVSPLAFGMAPAREAEIAGGMTKVPKAWGLAEPACSEFLFNSISVERD
jgi:hypothetical protein